MKYWIPYIVTLILVATAPCAMAQSRYGLIEQPPKSMEMGISVGATAPYMSLKASNGVSASPKIGMRAAMMMSLVWQQQFALQIELAYLYNNIETSRKGIEYDVKSNVMELPILFSYRGLGAIRFHLGPVLSLAASGRYSNGMERIEFGRTRPTLGYVAGVGLELSRHIVVDARFTGGLARTDNYFEGVEFRSSAYWASLGVSYVF